MVREPDATPQPPPQDHQLMSERRVLSSKPQPRLERRGQNGQHEPKEPDHLASLGDSVTSSTQTRFSVHTGALTGSLSHLLLGPDIIAGCGPYWQNLSRFELRGGAYMVASPTVAAE
jgi:hypothetical protein